MKKITVISFAFWAIFGFAWAQEQTQEQELILTQEQAEQPQAQEEKKEKQPKYSYFAESNLVLGGGDHAPFWFISNRHGTVSTKPQDFSLRVALFKDFEKREEQPTFLKGYRWNYAFGLDLIGSLDCKTNSIHQAYAKVKYGPFGAALGNFEIIHGNQDFALSSGGFGWSGNSRPMPRFDIGIPEFTEIPFTKGFVELKGVFSNGFFTDKRYVLDQKEPVWGQPDENGVPQWGGFTYNTLLHHKNVYARFGGKSIVNYTLGIEHYVVWAGKNSAGVKLPFNFKEYLNVVGAFMPAEKENITSHEGDNRYGEHSGQVNNRLDVKLKNYTISGYWQYFVDDATFRELANISDGLWGLLWRSNKKQAVTGVLLEYLNTTHQSYGHKLAIHGPSQYYNNSVYTSGWTYFGQTIGTPLILSQFYNEDNSLRLTRNRVRAYHLGIDGYITNDITYRSLLTYSEYEFGSWSRPSIEKNNFSFLAEVSTKIKKWEGFEIKTSIGGDFGKTYGNNFGLMLGIRKSGVF